ncbi:MAG TPA: DctP family TRAP transporter solute-binding subunit [Xanthobacteraceae bacterium]|jgi:C4-dicarboxylate-binding protein DctP|nr:DctP family TRAP transporter solute-binding subunit [Xanthobacteraceae bacterium]
MKFQVTQHAVTRRAALKHAALGIAAAVPVLGLGKPAFADPLVLKFSHVVSPDAPKGKAALLFKQLAEKYTDGKVTVEVYPNSSLYKDKEELEALQLGSVHLLAPSISKFGPLGVKEFDVFDLPFLMTDDDHARQMMASPMMDELNKKLEDKGVKPLAYWDNGAHVYTADKPLIMPDDFQGMKMRIQGSKVLDAVARQLGAIPQIIAFGELYQALQTGVVDGEDNVPSNIWTQKFYDVQKYLTVSHHGRLTYSLITNKKFWDSLPADVRPGLDRAVKESTEFFDDTAAHDNVTALDQIKATGKMEFHVQTPEEKKAWIAKLMPVHQEMQSRFGKDFLDRVYKASGFTPPQA